jgi:hypothetical protein
MKHTFNTLILMALAGSVPALGGLIAYDDKIASDNGGGLPHTGISSATLTFDTTNSELFDFGAISGSSTIEFIVSGDPVGGGQNGFLAVGSNGTHSLRYEQWNDTGALGFTHGGVVDYVFGQPGLPPLPPATPLSASPTEVTHVTYRWDQPTTTMELYLNGSLVGFNDRASGFQFPSGAGFLGNNAGLSQGMQGSIERVTIYNEAVEPATILAHSEAWNGPGGSLANYDSAIANDNAGALPYAALSGGALNFDTTNSEPFDFGAITDSATGEFIVSGDPVAGGQNGYLAEGANSSWSLRFEQWDDTGLLGFTHAGVRDNLFFAADAPRLPPSLSTESPTELTHVVYRWDQATTTMELYLDGVLAGVNTAATGFEMPTGSGQLGNNGGGTEGMLGTMERVTVYNDALSPEDILAHANAWLGSDDLRPLEINEVSHGIVDENVNVTLIWNSRPETSYVVETSLNLIDWEELTDSHPSEGERTSLVHSFSRNPPVIRLFYRVSVAP